MQLFPSFCGPLFVECRNIHPLRVNPNVYQKLACVQTERSRPIMQLSYMHPDPHCNDWFRGRYWHHEPTIHPRWAGLVDLRYP